MWETDILWPATLFREDCMRKKLPEKHFDEETEEGLSLGWKDVLALFIAFLQVIFFRVVIGIGAFALVIYLLGKLWLRCW